MIPATWRASVGYLLRHPWQGFLAILGVAVGVAVIVAVDLANGSSRKAFLLSMDAVVGEATHQVIGGPRGLDEAVYTNLRVDHGIGAIAPVVEGSVTAGDTVLTLLGVDLFAESEVRSFTSRTTTGESGAETLFREFLLTPGTVTMSGELAGELGLRRGDTFTTSSQMTMAALAGCSSPISQRRRSGSAKAVS